MLAASITAFGQNASPKAAVTVFYKYDSTHSQVFNRANIDARKRWFSARLYELFLKELEREKEYLAKNPGINLNISWDEEPVDLVRHGIHGGIRMGDVLTPDMIAVLRPGTGIPPCVLARVLGARLRVPVAAGVLLR